MMLEELKDCDIPTFTLQGCTVTAKPVNVYDGDTFKAIFRLPGTDDMFVKMRCRIVGIDAPELRPPRSEPNRDVIIREALASRNRLCQLLTGLENWVPSCDAHTKLVELTCEGWDKYGRLLVRIPDIASIMVEEGHAEPYVMR